MRRLLLVVAVGLLAWSGTVFAVRPSSSVLAALAATSPFVALPALVVVALALPRRAWVAALLAAVAAALPWGLVVGYASPGDVTARGGDPLRVMSFNAHLGNADAAELVRAVQEEDVDVLVLVEASDVLTNRLAAQGLGGLLEPVYVSGKDEVTNGLVVYSRLQVEGFRDVETPGGPIVSGTVITSAGPVHLVGAHATSPVREPRAPFVRDARLWTRDLELVARTARDAGADGRPVVVLGDLNATPWHAQFRRLERDGGVEDAADLLGQGLRPTWPTLYDTGGLIPLDHVLVSPEADVTEVGTVVVSSSDHAAVVASLRIPRD